MSILDRLDLVVVLFDLGTPHTDTCADYEAHAKGKTHQRQQAIMTAGELPLCHALTPWHAVLALVAIEGAGTPFQQIVASEGGLTALRAAISNARHWHRTGSRPRVEWLLQQEVAGPGPDSFTVAGRHFSVVVHNTSLGKEATQMLLGV